MSRAPQEMIEWSEELENILEEFLNNENKLKKIIDQEISEGEEVIEVEREEVELEGQVEQDIEKIQSDLSDIQEDIERMVDLLNDSDIEMSKSDKLSNFEQQFEEQLIQDIENIEIAINHIESEVNEIKEDSMEALQEIDKESQQYEGTYELLVKADNQVGKIDEMVDSFLQTAQDAMDDQLSRMGNTIADQRQSLEQRLSQLEEEEGQVGREINKEENIIMNKLLPENQQIMQELKQEITEDKQIIGELDKLKAGIDDLGDHDLAEHLDDFEEQMVSIEEHMESIFGAIEEMEEALETEASELDEANTST